MGKTAYRRISRTGQPSPTSRTGSFRIYVILTRKLAHRDPDFKLERLIYTYTGFQRTFKRSGGNPWMEDHTRAQATIIPAYDVTHKYDNKNLCSKQDSNRCLSDTSVDKSTINETMNPATHGSHTVRVRSAAEYKANNSFHQ